MDREAVKHMKIPLLDYIYFTFLQSEKISQEFNKYLVDFTSYIAFEVDRINASTAFSEEYYEYLHKLFFVLSAYKKTFVDSID